MKKLIITGLIVGSIACASFVVAKDWSGEANWGNGHQRFVAELNLDAERAEKMSAILESYREVPKLYFTNQGDKIPEFLAQKEAELAALLTPEELAQFKQSFAEWAKTKKFGFMAFSYSQPQSHQQVPTSPLPESLQQEIRKTFDNELLQLRQQLQQQTLNA
ncbi:hypothetical protein [Cellvibrio sp. KY-YJ-3]|uniref:hypothetical protein n=1 Tax=Cellvibrio sp. KY-YJ-3 TaxID=454662 RepID=UPI0012449E5D|nr:hypothetical protein [Cellvibrio sp. KY-YJ-3]QEY11497.1 hypothetical protein D0B88_03980 [Cellvibrio sp. KY-YJ-3]